MEWHRLTSTRKLASSAAAAMALLLTTSASAIVVLDTYDLDPPINEPPIFSGIFSLYNLFDDFGQSIAVPFTLAAPSTIDDVRTAIYGPGSYRLGVTTGPGLPTLALSHSLLLTNPVANTLHSGLNWALPAGDHWLLAYGIRGADGNWKAAGIDSIRPWAFTNPGWDAVWTAPFVGNAPAARIHATPVPEPATWALWLGGLGIVGWLARGQGRKTGRQRP